MTQPMFHSTDLEPSAEWRAKHIGLDESHHPQVAKLALTAESFCRQSIRNATRRTRWLVVGGNTGGGKTHAAKAVLRRFRACRIWAWENGYWGGAIPNATFWRWQKLADLDEADWRDAFEEIRGSEAIRGADLLILDDVGAETDRFKSGVPISRLQQVLEAMERRWLVITTNVTKSDWEKRWDKRIASRLSAAAYVSLFNVPDYRPKTVKA